VAADTTGRLDRLFKFAEIGVFDVLLSTRDTATLEVLADRLAARTPSIGNYQPRSALSKRAHRVPAAQRSGGERIIGVGSSSAHHEESTRQDT
jgi:hypothetical protein